MAVVSARARLGSGVRVGPFAIVEDDVEIGEGCEIRAHAVIKRFTTLGAGCVVFEGAVLGNEPQDLSFKGADSSLRVGERTVIREGVTLHRANKPGAITVIGSDCFLMAYAHVAHDCQVGDRVIMANNVALAGHVTIGDRAFLAGGVMVHQFCHVGRLAMIGGKSKVVQDCLPFVTTDGAPARAHGLNAVGLRRAGITAAELLTLKTAHRTLLRAGLPLAEALTRLDAMGEPLCAELAAFVRASQRGFAHAARRGGSAE
jgi:UDP-N-acetylglucosamine acyltransferase